MSIFSFLFLLGGVVNVEVGGYMSHIHKIYISMSSHKKIRSLLPKMASQWFDLPIFSFFVGWLMWRLGAISLIFTKYILIWAPTKKNQVSTPKNGFTMIWFDYIFLFPLCVGWLMWRWEAICLIFTKYNLIWAPTKKIRSLLPKMASQWSDLPIFSFFSFVWGG